MRINSYNIRKKVKLISPLKSHQINGSEMNRRTFSKKTGTFSLAALLSPALIYGQNGESVNQAISPAIQKHLVMAKREMKLGLQNRQHAILANRYLEPVKILKYHLRSDGYELSFQNASRRTITLSSVNGQRFTYIGN